MAHVLVLHAKRHANAVTVRRKNPKKQNSFFLLVQDKMKTRKRHYASCVG